MAQQGLEVVFARHAFDRLELGAVPAEQRAADLTELALDSRVHALIATCGGKTANALLPLLEYDIIGRARKPIVGFSDVGVILNAITAKTGLVTFYGPNVLSKLDESHDFSLRSLKGSAGQTTRTCSGSVCISTGIAEGTLIGGNLSTFTTSVAGTVYEPKRDQPVLFWEAGTKDWRLIDQYLGALAVRGTLSAIRGMVIGKVGEDAALSSEEIQFLKQRLGSLAIPVLWMPSFGHGHAENLAWPIGARVRVDAAHHIVTILDSLVEDA